MAKYLVEIEIRGPLERELRAADTVGGCLLVEQIVRNGFIGRTVQQSVNVSKMCTCAMHCVYSPHHDRSCCHERTCSCWCHAEEIAGDIADAEKNLFLTVRAMEHVTIPRALFTTGMASDSGV